jgi:DNA-binding transcriptional regulator YiaG
MKKRPDYRKIYTDILTLKYPDKKEACEKFLFKNELTAIDIININKKIFGNDDYKNLNQKHKSYHKSDIIKILEYQKNNQLNNSQLASHFNMSRNTISKWKKNFQV